MNLKIRLSDTVFKYVNERYAFFHEDTSNFICLEAIRSWVGFKVCRAKLRFPLPRWDSDLGAAKGTFSFINDHRKTQVIRQIYIVENKRVVNRKTPDTKFVLRVRPFPVKCLWLKINLWIDYYLQNKTK